MPDSPLGIEEDVWNTDIRQIPRKANALSRFLRKHPIFSTYVVFSVFGFLNTGFLELVISGVQWLWSFV